jgi:hypothetical protein
LRARAAFSSAPSRRPADRTRAARSSLRDKRASRIDLSFQAGEDRGAGCCGLVGAGHRARPPGVCGDPGPQTALFRRHAALPACEFPDGSRRRICRRRFSRSCGSRPPQMPNGSSAVTAYARHWPRTGHIAQMCRASIAGPSPGGKKSSGSAPTQSARAAQVRGVPDLACASSCGESSAADPGVVQ